MPQRTLLAHLLLAWPLGFLRLPLYRETETEREHRDRDTETEIEKQSQRETKTDMQRQRGTERERETQRQRGTERQRHRATETETEQSIALLGGSRFWPDSPLCSAAAVASDLMAAPTNTP